MADSVRIEMSRPQALVLYEWLARTNTGDGVVDFQDEAERRVLWDLESMLEATLIEPLQPDYADLLSDARSKVRDSE